MAAPIGRILSACKHFETRLTLLSRECSTRYCPSRLTLKQGAHQISCNVRYLKNRPNFVNLLSLSKAAAKPHEYRFGSNLRPRNLSSAPTLTDEEVRKDIEAITDKFMEAKEYMEDAKDSMDSVYFDEDMKDAEDAIKETLDMYQDLLGRLTEEQKQNVMRTIGLKMEELKAQLDMIKESLRE